MCVQSGAFWDLALVYCGICEMGLFGQSFSRWVTHSVNQSLTQTVNQSVVPLTVDQPWCEPLIFPFLSSLKLLYKQSSCHEAHVILLQWIFCPKQDLGGRYPCQTITIQGWRTLCLSIAEYTEIRGQNATINVTGLILSLRPVTK